MEWNEPLFKAGSGEQARVGVLVSHGFTGSPHSVQEIALRLADAGYTVAMPLLTGHGRTPEELEKARLTDWTADAEQAFAWLQERTDQVFATGLSMGGTLALHLAERRPEIAGIVTINALIRHPQEVLMRAVGRLGLPRWLKPVANDTKLSGVDEKGYDRIPSRAARQLALLLAAVREDLPLVRCPALVFSSAEDHVVPPDNQREIYETIASADKTLVRLPDSYHVATMDNDRDLIFAGTLHFIADRSQAR